MLQYTGTVGTVLPGETVLRRPGIASDDDATRAAWTVAQRLGSGYIQPVSSGASEHVVEGGK